MIGRNRPLLLGSASPRRSALLGSLGVPFVTLPADIVEDTKPGESPNAYLDRIVLEKFRAVQARLEEQALREGAAVAAILVADTTVVIDEQIVGKPADVAEAAVLLTRLVGRTHTVLTRYLLGAPRPRPPSGDTLSARTVSTQVKLRAASAAEVRAYAATGEGLDKAGAYAAQGLGAFLVEAVVGSYTNVVGLPVCELVGDLVACGLLASFPVSFE
ncbi:MAG TPA: nucleoside triphosphate pyrophosphatase [Polyangiaceae bacterium]|nr:nucleoside triphosphate pyrophosphatase [Polyangiaceae bacterium]